METVSFRRANLVKRHFYILCFLPDIKSFHAPPPVSKQKLLSVVMEAGGPTQIVKLLLLNDDLLQRDAVLAGEIEPKHADTAVLSYEQLQAKEPLPDFLVFGQKREREFVDKMIMEDRIRHNYFHYVSKIAETNRSKFLKGWIEFEVGLRNALAKVRAEALKLDPKPYLVAPELGSPAIFFENIIADWKRAPDPLESSKVLDKARWNRLTELERWYSFSNDEIAAYTVKLMILQRWWRITEKDHQ